MPRTRPAWQLALVLFAVAAAGAFAAAAILGRKEPATTAPRTLSELPSPEGIEFQNPALSPDGTWLAMRARATPAASAQIWIRNLATGDVRPVAGTEHGAGPFWSPDGRSLGFVDVNDHWLKRIDLEGGRSVRLAKLGTGFGCGATWGSSEIVYCATPTYSLHRVAPSGGEASELTHPGKGEGHYAPWFLRDGKRFLFTSFKDGGGSTVRLASFDGGLDEVLLQSDTRALVYGGRLYYGRGTTLLTRGFDEPTGKLSAGEAEIIAEGVAENEFTVAAGLLVFSPNAERRGSRVTIYDRGGNAVDKIDSDGYLDDLTLSPDGRLAAVMKRAGESADGGNSVDVWRLDLERKIFDRVTFGEADDDPVFSPDGSQLAFAHGGDLFVKPTNGSGEPKLLAKKIEDIVTNDWTAGGQIVYTDIAEDGGEDLFAITAGGGEPRSLTKTPFSERNAMVSPDGRWLAYASDESGDMQVYLTAWPSLDGKWRVSSDKAAMPRWRDDSRELYFLAHDQHLMSATVEPDGSAPKLGLPRRIFAVHKQVSYLARTSRWAVMPDGLRFLVLEPLSDGSALRRPLTLVAPLPD